MRIKLIIIISAFVFTYSLNLYSQPDAVNNVNKVDELGKKQGQWSKYENGILKYEGQFKNDKPVGTFKYYYKDKSIKALTTYSANAIIARTIMYHPNSKKSAEGIYHNEEKDSIWNYFDDNEGLISKETFFKGLKHGVSKIYYLDGGVSEELNWKNGIRDGAWVQYFKNGNIKLSATYKNGKLDGMIKQYYVSGKIKYYGKYVNSQKHGTWMRMNEDGKPAKKDIYNKGVVTNTIYYDKSLEIKDKELEEGIKK